MELIKENQILRSEEIQSDKYTVPVEETNKNDFNLGYWRNNYGSSDNILACTGDLTTTSCTYSTLNFLHANSATRTVEIVIDLYNGFKKKKTMVVIYF